MTLPVLRPVQLGPSEQKTALFDIDRALRMPVEM